jgi:hypothetical protein
VDEDCVASGDGVLVQAQVGGEAAANMRHAASERYQQWLVGSLDFYVATGLGGSYRLRPAAYALVQTCNPVEELGLPFGAGGTSGCLGANECLSSHTDS